MQKSIYLILIFIVVSCSKVKKQETLSTEPIEVIFEGPLFEGSNTGQYNLDGYAKRWLESYNASHGTKYKIAFARLLKAEVEVVDQPFLTTVVLHLASKNEAMKQLAVLNPINGNGWLSMTLGSDVEIGKFLKDQETVMVTDAGLSQDLDDNVTLRFKLSIGVSLNE